MTVHFLQIGDTHLGGQTNDELSPGVAPYARTMSMLASIERWIEVDQVPIDFVIHTGDLVHRGHLPEDDGNSTRVALQWLHRIPCPLHMVVGNHDHRDVLREQLGQPPGTAIPGSNERWAYHFELRGERFVVLDARAERAIDPRGSLCDAQLDFVNELMQSTDETVTFFLHYPPLPLDCAWIDATMLVVNGHDFHERIRPYAPRVRGVFYGHVHRPTCALRDGILYASCGSTSMHFPNWPHAAFARLEADAIGFANYVRIDQHGALIKTQWIEFENLGTSVAPDAAGSEGGVR